MAAAVTASPWASLGLDSITLLTTVISQPYIACTCAFINSLGVLPHSLVVQCSLCALSCLTESSLI
jgi:hypothetical protein